MHPQSTFSDLLKDYPFIAKGLAKLSIVSPLDLQQQLLTIPTQIQNLILCGPPGCGKKLALMILSIRKFVNEEEGILVFIAHSKQLSQQLASLTSVITKIPITNLFMQKCQTNTKKCIIVASPIQLCELTPEQKNSITTVVLFQSDFLFGFGYGAHLQKLAEEIPKHAIYQIDCIKIGSELESFKLAHMKTVTKIHYQPPTQQKQVKIQRKHDTQVVHFYQLCTRQLIPISLYVTLKFALVNPKILLLVPTLKQIYKYHLFLDRTKIENVVLYNHLNPIDLKFYTLSLWMNGNIDIMIASKQLFQDINRNIFKQNCKKIKKQCVEFTNLATVICINLKHVEPIFKDIFNSFSYKPFIMTFIQNTEQQILSLENLLKYQTTTFTEVKSKQFPIPKTELESFHYRINDVWMSLGTNKIDMFQKYDFKKKLLKSPDLAQYLQLNPQSKNQLITQVKYLKEKLNLETVSLSPHVPIYLVPQCLKKSYENKMKQIQKQTKKQQIPKYMKKARNALNRIDPEQQNPQTTDISRLALISSRKRWKLQHGFKLKKKNIHKQRKGIFDNS